MNRYLRLTALIIAGEMIYSLPFHTQRYFRPTMLEVFELSNTQNGDMFAVFGITAAFSYFFGGPFADRYSARSLMVVSLVLTAIGGLYMATIPSIGNMSVLYGYWGITTSLLFWAALIKATRDWGGDSSQGTAFGVLDGGRGLAAAIFAAIAVGILAQYLPTETALVTDDERRSAVRSIILFYSLLTFLSAIIVWFFIPITPGQTNQRGNPFAGVPQVMRRPLIWTQAAVIICAYCGYKGLDNYSLYATQVLNMNEIDAALLSTYGAYVRPVAAIIAGIIADRYNSSKPILVLFGIMIATYGALSYATPDIVSTNVIFANIFVSYFAVFAIRGIYYALLEETNTPKHLTGASVAVIAFVGYTPEAFFGPVAGRILDANPGVVGHLNLFTFLGAVSVVGVLVTVVLIRLNSRSKESAEPEGFSV